MRILERDRFLNELGESLAAAAAGAGSVALVCGEAGIGKTKVVDTFEVRAAERGTRSLRGSCDALHTPRPLGPLLDIARAAGGRLRALAEHGTDREQLFATLLDELRRPAVPTLVIFEDVHWADEATLDLLKLLGRRVGQTSALIVVTYRDDALPPQHPLRGAFADLPRKAVRRFTLPRLSEAAVEELAREAGRPAAGLYALTSGNPFFVTEVFAGAGGVPVSVRDAIFARAARLDESARAVLDAISLVPGRMERWLLDALVGPASTAVEACLAAGVLEAHGRDVGFRHELARLAWECAVDGERAHVLHGRVLAELVARYGGEEGASAPPGVISAARLVHHASRADDRVALLRLAPVAAREAVRLGAHREAAAHYEMALDCAAGLPPGERAEMLEAYAIQCYLTGAGERAVAALEEALGELAAWLWRAGDKVPGEVIAASAEPYALELRGESRRAAAAWERLGFPFERALALARSEEAVDAHEALCVLHELGARRAAEVVAGELRARGVRSLPRGPRPGTRRNPANLTRRQLRVLALIAEGLTNAEIAERLFIAPKTVEHHVSAILTKLDARSRVEAAVRARELGAHLPDPGFAK